MYWIYGITENADQTKLLFFVVSTSTFVFPMYITNGSCRKRLVSAVVQEDPLTIQVVRGTNVLERHESMIVDLCSVAGVGDKEVEDCVVDFLSGGYDYEDDAVESDSEECEKDNDGECLIDDMMNLWADEIQAPSTTTGITKESVTKASKPKPWSSRSSGSGTWVRDPKTGKMRNIDA